MTDASNEKVHNCECEICWQGEDTEIMGRHHRINLLLSRLAEAQRRWYVATLSGEPDSPSDREWSLISGLDEKTIQRGRQELAAELTDNPEGRERRKGGGRYLAEKKIRN